MMNDRILAAVQSPPLKGFSGFAFAEDGIVIGFKFLGAYRVRAGSVSFSCAHDISLDRSRAMQAARAKVLAFTEMCCVSWEKFHRFPS